VVKHSPDAPETVVEQSQANEYREWLHRTVHNPCGPSLLWTCTDRESSCGAQGELIDGAGAEIQHSICSMNIVIGKTKKSVLTHSLKPKTAPTPFGLELQHHCGFPSPPLVPSFKPPDLTKQAQCLERTDIVSTRSGNVKGLYSPKPFAACYSHPSGIKTDGRLRWKPSDMEEMK
jgi:hypothetical protein